MYVNSRQNYLSLPRTFQSVFLSNINIIIYCSRLDTFKFQIFLTGNDFEGCPPKCASSEFGCCDDNVSEATGPEQEGCLLEEITSTTETGEELTTTEITTLESEETTTIETTTSPEEYCNNTTYRCCPDGVTTAQGPGKPIVLIEKVK